MSALRGFFEEIKVEHTLFALPFAYVGALLAQDGLPPLRTIAWITLAVIGARTAAMSTNRLLDARLDAANPRTARRLVASGRMRPSVLVIAAVIGLALLTLSAAELNPLCLALVPLGIAALVFYPLAKRVSWGVHFLLGAVDGLAPLGGWLAVTGKFQIGALLLFVAVALWVAGFDILYALMDRDVDIRDHVHSIPARFGEQSGRTIPQFLHGLVVATLVWLGVVAHVRPLYWAGVAAALALLAYELALIRRQRDAFALNHAVFQANMAFSVVFFLTTAASLVAPRA